MLCLLAYSAAQLTWMLLPQKSQDQGQQMLQSGRLKVTKEHKADLNSVAELHLFGRAEKVAQAPGPAIVDAPDTRLNLTLHGIVDTGVIDTSLAIIADGSKTEKHYRINDRITGGAILKEIHADRVILQRSGRLETLRLPVDAVKQGKNNRNKSFKSGSTHRKSTALAGKLQRYRERVMKNPVDAWKVVSVQPVMEGDKLTGYRIKPKRDKLLFRQAGLMEGDVVTGVNGIELDDSSKMGQVISHLSNADRLELQIKRGGTSHSVVVDFK